MYYIIQYFPRLMKYGLLLFIFLKENFLMCVCLCVNYEPYNEMKLKKLSSNLKLHIWYVWEGSYNVCLHLEVIECRTCHS